MVNAIGYSTQFYWVTAVNSGLYDPPGEWRTVLMGTVAGKRRNKVKRSSQISKKPYRFSLEVEDEQAGWPDRGTGASNLSRVTTLSDNDERGQEKFIALLLYSADPKQKKLATKRPDWCLVFCWKWRPHTIYSLSSYTLKHVLYSSFPPRGKLLQYFLTRCECYSSWKPALCSDEFSRWRTQQVSHELKMDRPHATSGTPPGFVLFSMKV